ncbi:MAG: transcriptional repressor [Patescibacteria group bacterium]
MTKQKNNNNNFSEKKVLNLFDRPEKHPTAPEIFSILKETIKDLTLINLEKTLTDMEKQNKIGMVFDKQNIRHYHKKGETHCHFICSECGLVKNINFEKGAMEMIENHAQKKAHSFGKVEQTNLSFQGKCWECLKNNK